MADESRTDDTLKTVAAMADIIGHEVYVDGTSKIEKRTHREAADTLREAIEKGAGLVTPQVLLSFYMGAMCQAQMDASSNPVVSLLRQTLGESTAATSQPHTSLLITIGYMARDVLAGERVE